MTLENEILVIAKSEEDALEKMRDLQREYIIGAFGEEYSEEALWDGSGSAGE